jgi:TonB family protein
VTCRRLPSCVLAGLLLALSAPAYAEPPAEPAPAALSKAPKLLRFVPAEVPATLSDHHRVTVVLTIDVDERGSVASVTVAEPSPFAGEGYEDAALAAARQFMFEPGEAGGKPVPVRITYRYQFIEKLAPAPAATDAPSPESPAPVPTVPLDGRVLEKGERTPLAGVTVVIGDAEAVTDGEGGFHLDVPPGPHVARLAGPGITPAQVKLTANAGKKLQVTWYVAAKTRYSSTVRGQRVVQETVETTLSGEELRRIPGTQGDTLKAVQTLPGVARAPFGSGQIVVWGSAPEDTRSYVDGVYIPTLFHFFGLRSTLTSEMVDSLSFSPGGYGVEHGRGLGGVIDIETRKPRDDGIHGFVQLDLIDASLLLEAKITKTLSIAVAARRSVLDATLSHLPINNFQLTPVYYDYQLKLAWKPTPNDDLELFLFGADDSVSLTLSRPDPALSAEFASHTFFHRLMAKYQHRWGKASVTITPFVGYDTPIEVAVNLGNNDFHIDATTVAYGVRAVARLPLAPWLRLDAGLDFEGAQYAIDATTPISMPREGDSGIGRAAGAPRSDNVTSYTNHTAPYVAAYFALFGKRLLVTPGFRLDIYTLTGYRGTPNEYDKVYINPEPRLSVRYQLNRWAALKAALGVYHQPPDQNALTKSFGNPDVIPQLSFHYVLGADFDPIRTLHIEVAGFYKDLRDLIVRGQTATDPILENDGIGRVYGGEMLVRQELWHNFYGWVTYTLSRAERKDHPTDAWRNFEYDQTHILQLIASYKLPRGFQLGIRFRYVTGNPITPVIGGYYDANAGQYRPIQGPTYSARAADFNQLDVRLDKTWTYNRWKMSLYLDIQNIYNYRSEEGRAYNYNYSQYQPVTGLPILPALGIRGEW